MSGHRTDNDEIGRYAKVRRSGPFLFVAGLSGRAADNSIPGVTQLRGGETKLDTLVQANACFENLKALLAEHDVMMNDLVDLTCYLTQMDDYMEFVVAFNRAFEDYDAPPRTTVGVASLPDPHLCVEIKAVAELRGG